jgi:hypothetical protein
MCSVDHTSYPKRYSLVKRDGASWDESNFASNYNDTFAGSDGQWDSPYREWKIIYNAETQRLDAYIAGQFIGYDILDSEMSELYLEIGYTHPAQGSTNGYIETDLKNFSMDFNKSNPTHRMDPITRKLEIDKKDAYNSGFYYERTFSHLSPSNSFVYEAKVIIDRFSAQNTPYILSIGRLQDGNKDINLCALYRGSAKTIGFWSGKNPWSITEGYTDVTLHDWSEDTIYKIVKDVSSGYVYVYINGDSSPIISREYSTFPNTNPNVSITSFNTKAKFRRSASFGIIDVDRELVEVIDPAMDSGDIYDPGVHTLISGTGWLQTELTDSNTTYNNYDSSLCAWNSTFYYNEPDAGNYDEYVKYTPTTITGTEVSVYCISTYVASDRPTDIPYTIYHSGVVELPVVSSINNITTVNDGINHSGVTQSGTATTIDIDGTKYYNGADYDFSLSLGSSNQQLANGAVYLGTYTDVSDIYVTRDCSTGTYFSAGVIFVHTKKRNTRLKSTSTSLWSYIRVQADVTELHHIPQAYDMTGFSIIDTEGTGSLLDYYGEFSDPEIPDNNIIDSTKF